MQSKHTKQLTAVACSLIALLTVVSAGCKKPDAAKAGKEGQAAAAAQPPSVSTEPAKSETVLSLVPVTGSLQALQTVELFPKIAARVSTVLGREGASVSRGQVVVQQETADLERQVEQSRANVETARAKLAQAQTNYQVQITNSDSAVKDAQEQVRSAQAALELTRRPQRSQEVIVAENNVKQSQANYDKAKSDRERYETLFKEGATPAITLDQYVTQEKVAKAALDSAKQQLDIAKEGGRTESIRQQESVVARARQTLRQAQANRGNVAVRREDIESAKASLAQAQAALGVAQQALADASLRSPIDGVISDRKVEPGQLASPGQSVLQLIALDTVYFEAQINETDVASVHQGQTVQVHLDAYPNRTFTGTIVKLNPQGSATGRIFTARVQLANQTGALRPGLFARGEVIVARHPNSVTAPVEAIIRSADDETKGKLFTVENDIAKAHDVTLGLQTPDGRRYVIQGIQPGEEIVVAGQRSLKDGDRVNSEKVTSSPSPSASPDAAGGTAQ